MKIYLIALLPTLLYLIYPFEKPLEVKAGNVWHFSNTGSDGFGDGTLLNPYATIAKLNTLSPSSGDTVKFKGGDVFVGEITQPQNGSTGNPVVYTSYGTGKATISGYATLGAGTWTNLGSNLWRANVNSGLAMDVFVKNDFFVLKGRTPNVGTYWTMEGHGNSTGSSGGYFTGATVTSSSLSGTAASYVGATVYIRVNPYNTDPMTVTAGSSNTLTYKTINNNVNFTMEVGNKIWMQDALSTVTQQDEWYYNSTAGTVTMYSTTDPGSMGIKVGQYTYAMRYFKSGTHAHDITFNNLKFEGQDSIGLMFLGVDNVVIKNCEFKLIGTDAVSFGDAPYGDYPCYNMTVDSNRFRKMGNSGVVMRRSSMIRVRENDMDTIGTLEGMGLGGNQQHVGIMIENPEGTYGAFNDSIVVYHNVVKKAGYCGIRWTGGKATVSYNLIDTYGMIQSDGGGIYTSRNAGDSVLPYRDIHHNIIINSIGYNGSMSNSSNGGTPGIYNDDVTVNADIHHNTIIDGTRYGVFLHNNRNIRIQYNNIYNSKGEAGIGVIKDGLEPWYPTRGLDIHDNYIYASTTKLMEYQSIIVSGISSSGDIANYGSINNMRYAKSSGTNYWTYYDGGSQTNYTSKSSWTSAWGYDAGSAITTVIADSMQIFYNATLAPVTKSFTGLTYRDLDGNNYSNSLVLQPYESIIVRRVTYIAPTTTDPIRTMYYKETKKYKGNIQKST